MQAIREIVHPSDNHVTIQVPSAFVGIDIEVVAFPASVKSDASFDFSDLAGKLKWSGDAVKEQRALRDEW
jgi:hypothetical protein